MKKFVAVLTLCVLLPLSGARAQLQLYIADGTISRDEARNAAVYLEGMMEQPVKLVFQEEKNVSLRTAVSASGECVAIVPAAQAAALAREGLLQPIDGCVPSLAKMAQGYVDACVMDEQLMFAPLLVKLHVMAVRRDWFEAVNMGYLLDSRAHLIWYPSEFVQALDEMAVRNRAGLEIWLPQERDLFWLSSLLCCASEIRYMQEETGAYAVDVQEMEQALSWLEDMLCAELMSKAESREEALKNFLDGETAVFVDWTAEESRMYAQRLQEEEILLRAYPSLTGTPLHAGEMIVLCALRTREGDKDLSRRAVSLLTADLDDREIIWKRGLYDDGAKKLAMYGMQEYGATLGALLREAAQSILLSKSSAQEAAQRIDRTMRTAGYEQTEKIVKNH